MNYSQNDLIGAKLYNINILSIVIIIETGLILQIRKNMQIRLAYFIFQNFTIEARKGKSNFLKKNKLLSLKLGLVTQAVLEEVPKEIWFMRAI